MSPIYFNTYISKEDDINIVFYTKFCDWIKNFITRPLTLDKNIYNR